MRIGLRCPASVSSVSEVAQLGLVARKGGGRFWLSSSRIAQSSHLASSLLGAGFNLPLGIIISDSADGRQIAQNAGELALLSRQKVIVAWSELNSTTIHEFLNESKEIRAAQLLGMGLVEESAQDSDESELEDARSDFAQIIRLQNGVSSNELLSRGNLGEVDFIFYELSPLSDSGRKMADTIIDSRDGGLTEFLDKLSGPFGIGQSMFDRLEDQELVIGLDRSVNYSGAARELFALEKAVEEATQFVSKQRVARTLELFG